MAKKPKPWFWEERNGWYVTIAGQRHPLGEHPKDAPRPKKLKYGWNVPDSIDDAFRKLQGGEAPKATAEGDCVAVVLDEFLTWCKENRAARTATRYEDFIQEFVKATGDTGTKLGLLPAARLTSKQVTQWLGQHPKWNATTKRNAITALQRGFNWAVKNLGLARNPIRGMEKPEAKRRTEIVTPDEFQKLLAAVPDQRFRDLLTVSYDSGGRPFEVKDLEKRHVQIELQRAVIPADEAKGRKRARTIYFPTERSLEIIRRLCGEHEEGPLFRNRLGNAWTGMAVKCRLEDLDHVLGRRVTHYALRHSFVTRKLLAGVDSHVVASLAGHQDTSMIDRVYSHVAEDHAFMLAQASKDISPAKDAAASASTQEQASVETPPPPSPEGDTQPGHPRES